MVVEPRGAWEHSAYQTDNQFVLEVRPLKVDPNKLTQGPGFQGEKLSLNFQNIEVRALLQVIADFTNFNVVTSDTVTGNVTLRLKDVPWDQALDIILQSKGLGVRKNGNVLWIAPKDELAAKEQLDLEAKKKIAELEPLRTQSFQLNYTKAEEVATRPDRADARPGRRRRRRQRPRRRILSPRGSVIFEQRTNQLFVTRHPVQAGRDHGADRQDRHPGAPGADRGAHRRGRRHLRPRAGRQARCHRPERHADRGAGVPHRRQLRRHRRADRPDRRRRSTSATRSSSTCRPTSARSAARRRRPSRCRCSASSANRFLNLELSALEADGKGKIVSSPRVITADQVKALIEQGEEMPYQEATSSGATAIQFRKANLQARGDAADHARRQRDPGPGRQQGQRRRAARSPASRSTPSTCKTQVLVENGGTVVIGGIFTQTERNEINKVPLLGDIPYVGNLFKNTPRSTNKTELLVFITPKIVTDRSAAR